VVINRLFDNPLANPKLILITCVIFLKFKKNRLFKKEITGHHCSLPYRKKNPRNWSSCTRLALARVRSLAGYRCSSGFSGYRALNHNVERERERERERGERGHVERRLPSFSLFSFISFVVRPLSGELLQRRESPPRLVESTHQLRPSSS